MRFSNLLISLALLFTMGSVYAEHRLIGVWTVPNETYYDHDYCCIPDEIRIDYGGGDTDTFTAFYQFGYYRKQCNLLFNTSLTGFGSLVFYNRTSPNSKIERFTTEVTRFGSMTFYYDLTREGLIVYTDTSASSKRCNFTMEYRNPLFRFKTQANPLPAANNYTQSSSSIDLSDFYYVPIVGLLVTAAFIWFKRYTKKKNDAVLAKHIVVRAKPLNISGASGQFADGENGYAAPGQFTSPNDIKVNY